MHKMIPLDTKVYVKHSRDRRKIHEWAESQGLYSRSVYDKYFPNEGELVFEKCVGCNKWYNSTSRDEFDVQSCSTCGYHFSSCPYCGEENGFPNGWKRGRYRIRCIPMNNIIIASRHKIHVKKNGLTKSFPYLLHPGNVDE